MTADPIPIGIADDAAALSAWLRDRDVACPLCGYNLRGLTGDRCPECGRDLRLSVSLADPFLKAWVALLVAVLLPAGFGLVLLVGIVYGIVDGLGRGGGSVFRGMDNIPLAPCLICLHLTACVPASALTLVLRRPFMRRTRQTQAAMAAAAWIALSAEVLYLLWHLLF